MTGKTLLLATAAAAMLAATVAPANAAAWWESTSINGRMYYDFTNLNKKTNGVKSTDSGTSFDIKRFYVGIDHKFNDTFSANVTTDFTYDAGAGATQVYIKKAYLEANLSPALDIRLGSTDLPWIPFVEGVYGYRYVENTLIDRTHFGTSADWGVHVKGKFAHGMLNYAISAVNGAGYKKTYRTQGIDVEGRLSANFRGFVLAVGGYTGKLGATQGTKTYHTANRFDALAAYKMNGLRVGFEYFHANDWNNVKTIAKDSSDGYSAFASYQFTKEFGAFGRYDWINPTQDTNSKLKDHYFNAGVSYTPYKMVDFALVYKRDKIDATPFTPETTANEVGVWGRLRW